MVLQPNANWTTENDAPVKRPIYAVQIDGGPEWFYDYDITSGTTGNHYQRLVSITGASARYNPVRFEASIGGFSFTILNPGKTEIFSWWSLDELYLKKVIVKAGYDGLAWEDFETIATAYVLDIGTNAGHTGMTFRCQDPQNQMNQDIMTAVMSEKGTAESGAANTLVDSALDQVDDYWNDGLIHITDGTGVGQTRTVSGFEQSSGTVTVSVNWGTNPDSTSDYSIISDDGTQLSRNPITMWLQIMLSTGDGDNWPGTGTNYDNLLKHMGLGIDYPLVDIEECELIRDDFLTTWQGDFYFTETVNAKEFFEDQIYLAYALRPVVKANGLISLRTFLPPLYGYLDDNNMASLLTDSDIIALPKWKMDFRDIINKINWQWGWNWYDDTYDFSPTDKEDAASIAKYKEQAISIESKSLTTALDGENLLQTITNRYFQRFAQEPLPISITTAFSERIVEPGDQVFITSGHIPNIDDSNFTWTIRAAEVEEVMPDYPGGKMVLKVRDISTGGFKYGVISPGGTPDFGGASAAEKLRYCWIDNGYYII